MQETNILYIKNFCYRFLLVFIILFLTKECKAVFEYKNWAWHFPPGSNMGVSTIKNNLK